MALASWGSNSISLSGRLVVLKSVASAIPLYHMAVYKAPVGVTAAIERLMRGYLWGRAGGGRRIPWVAWEQVCKGREIGGLGVGFLSIRNKAMFLKWAWRFGNEVEALWRRVLCSKYQLLSNSLVLHRACIHLKRPSRYVFDIVQILMEDSILGRAFRDNCFCIVGQGTQISFWLEPWAAAKPLALLVPRMYSMAVNRDATVGEVGSFLVLVGFGSWYSEENFLYGRLRHTLISWQ